uniref:Uncharacterized protein LOC103941309 n=1 Tax=Rhizophora mucronata TaxID=61149 RepID=A0A2P2KFU5_RHIMU
MQTLILSIWIKFLFKDGFGISIQHFSLTISLGVLGYGNLIRNLIPS